MLGKSIVVLSIGNISPARRAAAAPAALLFVVYRAIAHNSINGGNAACIRHFISRTRPVCRSASSSCDSVVNGEQSKMASRDPASDQLVNFRKNLKVSKL